MKTMKCTSTWGLSKQSVYISVKSLQQKSITTNSFFQSFSLLTNLCTACRGSNNFFLGWI